MSIRDPKTGRFMSGKEAFMRQFDNMDRLPARRRPFLSVGNLIAVGIATAVIVALAVIVR